MKSKIKMDAADFECPVCLGKKKINSKSKTDDYRGHVITFLDLFESPIRVTQCGHVLCEKCLLGISNGEQRWYCPECRKLHNCAVNTLARNYHLEKLVEKFKKINGIKLEEPPQGKNQSSRCYRLSQFSSAKFEKFF